MLNLLVYPWILLVVSVLFGVFLGMLILRLIFNYSDPNPFGKWGRFGYKVRKVTEKWVYPASRFLSTFKIDPRLGPILTALIGLVLTFFFMQIIGNTFFVIDGLTAGAMMGNARVIFGFVLYGLLSVLVLFIFIRVISFWFVFTRNTLFGLAKRITDPILIPAQRLIPPIGMFDISAMIVLLLISFLQSIVLRAFVYQ
jgi:YggT family protein